MFDNSRGGLNWGAEWSGKTQVLVNVQEPSRSLCAMDTNAENDGKHTDYIMQTSFRSLTFGPTTSAMPSSRATAAGMPGLQHAKYTELMNQLPSRIRVKLRDNCQKAVSLRIKDTLDALKVSFIQRCPLTHR